MDKGETIFFSLLAILIFTFFLSGSIIEKINNTDKVIIKPVEVVNTDSIINIKDSIILSQKMHIKMLQQMISDNN